MKKLQFKFQARLCLALCLLAAFLTAAVSVPRTSEETVWDGIVYEFSAGQPLSFSKLEAAKIDPERIRCAASCQESSYLTVNREQVALNLQYVTPEIADACGIEMAAGTFFDQGHLHTYPNSVVISDALAAKLFLSPGLGSRLTINGEEYRVVGVYRKTPGLFQKLAGRNDETVYLPETAGGRNRNIDTLYVSGLEGQSDYQLRQQLLGKLGASFRPVNEISLDEKKLPLTENVQLLTLFCYCFFLVAGVRLLIGLIKRLSCQVREFCRDSYLIRALLHRWYVLLPELLVFAAGCWLLYLGFQVALFDPELPADFLPDTNLFDLGFYWNVILNKIQANNTVFSGYQPVLKQISVWYYAQVCLLSASLLALWSVLRNCRQLGLCGGITLKTVLGNISCFVLGILLGCGLTASLDLRYSFPLWPLIFLVCFFIPAFWKAWRDGAHQETFSEMASSTTSRKWTRAT